MQNSASGKNLDLPFPIEVTYQPATEDFRVLLGNFSFWSQNSGLLVLFCGALPGLLCALILGAPFAFFGVAAFTAILILRHIVTIRQTPLLDQIDPKHLELCKIKLLDEFMSTESASEKSYRAWKKMDSCELVSEGIILRISPLYRMLIPTRSFENTSHQEFFHQKMAELIEDARASEIEVIAPQLIANPLPASVEYEQTILNLIQAQNQYANRNPKSLSPLWSMALVVLPSIAAIAGTLACQKYLVISSNILVEIISGILFIFGFIVIAKVIGRLLVQKNHGKETLKNVRVYVDLGSEGLGLRTTSSSFVTRHEYIKFAEVLPSLDVAVVSKMGMAIVLIPKIAFESIQHRDFFVRTLNAFASAEFRLEQEQNSNSTRTVESGNPFQPPGR